MTYVIYKGIKYEVISRELDLSSKNIEDITKIKGLTKITNLNGLNLSNNNISKIEGLKKLVVLEKLELSNNRIKEISGLNTLEHLEMFN
ncbi:hypothetical protein LCGC14_2848710 [marine sediment metagenome]|uniref:Leucine-rich repeat domain-containing protein n=1 Tax=marine sediment metagenome TaxID=412755 RepID=A0A0F9AHE5_9ZZZZ